MFETKADEPEAVLYQEKRVTDSPFYHNKQDMELAAFPHLYPSGRFGKSCQRPIQLTANDFVKHKLNHRDPRFRREIEYLFFENGLKDWRSIEQGSPNLCIETVGHKSSCYLCLGCYAIMKARPNGQHLTKQQLMGGLGRGTSDAHQDVEKHLNMMMGQIIGWHN